MCISAEFAEVQRRHPNQHFAYLLQQSWIQGLIRQPCHGIKRRPRGAGPSHLKLQNRRIIQKRLPFPTRGAGQGEAAPYPGVPPWRCRWWHSGYRTENLELSEDLCRPCSVRPRKRSPESHRWRHIKGWWSQSSSWLLLTPSTLRCLCSPSEVPDTGETPSQAVQLLLLQDRTGLQNEGGSRVVCSRPGTEQPSAVQSWGRAVEQSLGYADCHLAEPDIMVVHSC